MYRQAQIYIVHTKTRQSEWYIGHFGIRFSIFLKAFSCISLCCLLGLCISPTYTLNSYMCVCVGVCVCISWELKIDFRYIFWCITNTSTHMCTKKELGKLSLTTTTNGVSVYNVYNHEDTWERKVWWKIKDTHL